MVHPVPAALRSAPADAAALSSPPRVRADGPSDSLPPSARTETGHEPPSDEEQRLAPGAVILGTYVIERQLGRGGMGTVYLARDDVSGQRVAVKVLPGSLARERGIRERFIQEARALAALDHPGIVPLITFAQQGDDRYLVMKYVAGESLEARIRAHKVLAPDEARRILREVCGALDYAHAKGVVHRDIKPANVLIDDRGRVVVVDFGIARKLEGEKRLTQTGMLMGTPQYMSPEQIEGHTVDGRADLYACGLLLFEMLAGRPPFDGERTFDILKAHVEKPVPDVRALRRRTCPEAAPIPDDVVALVDALLQKDPSARPKNGAAVVDILDGKQKLPPPSSEAITAPFGVKVVRAASTTETPALAFTDTRAVVDDEPVRVPGGNPALRALAALSLLAVGGGVGYALFRDRLPMGVAVDVDAGAPAAPDRAFEVAALLSRARVAHEAHRYDDARVAVDTALALDPDAVDALLLRAEILLDGNNPDEARATLARLPEQLTPDFAARRAALAARLPGPSTPSPSADAGKPAAPGPARPKKKRPSQLSNEALLRITGVTNPRISGCYVEHILAKDPTAEGDVTLTARIAPDGAVADVTIQRSAFVNRRFLDCLTDAARTWRFPAFDGDADVVLKHFTFKPEP